jgi:dihydropteroate synthase
LEAGSGRGIGRISQELGALTDSSLGMRSAERTAEIGEPIASKEPTPDGRNKPMASSRERILFITGKLAEYSLRQVVARLSERVGFDYRVAVLPISVAALMHVDWVRRKLQIEESFDRVVLPGWCQGDLESLSNYYGVSFERGPKDLHNLPDQFGQRRATPDLSRYDIEIIAEINHATRLSDADLVALAASLRRDGADVIDVGCVPGEESNRTGEIARILKSDGFRVSIDSFNRREVEDAVAAGAELVLSCNGSNVDWAARLPAEVVAIPDNVRDLSSLDGTIEQLDACKARYRIDPVLEPIGHGFSRSLNRYVQAREHWPNAAMMMGVGNITELTEVDSAGVNVILAGVCQELGIRSVLTTQVINWARTSVRELDLARRIVFHSLSHGLVPKHINSQLVVLRDPKIAEMTDEELTHLAQRITDPNYRIFLQSGMIHLLNRDGHWSGRDPFELIRQAAAVGKGIDSLHAFYLGYEMCKAATALALGKQYTQDQALTWGYLTVPEIAHRDRPGVDSRSDRSSSPDRPS